MDDGLANQIGLHVPRMYRAAYRLLGDAEAAQDVVQEACLKALGKMGGFDGRASLATWLHRITVNCAKDAARGDGRRDAAHRRLHSRQRAPAGDGPQADSPALAAERRELAGLAWRLVEQLPEDCRSVFELTQLDGYSYDEAAEIEGQPRGTVASRVFRAKKMLLEQMNAQIDGRSKP